MNQNLFRVYSYMSTSAFFNVISATGFLMHEAGPFTRNGLYSREEAAKVDFRVGSPWGKTALLTGWGVDDLLYRTAHIEYYFTSYYIGFEHRFSPRLDVKALAEDVRAWRIYQNRWGICADLAPRWKHRFHPEAQLGPAGFKFFLQRQRVSRLRRNAKQHIHILFAAISPHVPRESHSASR